jgi:hypothetical protein
MKMFIATLVTLLSLSSFAQVPTCKENIMHEAVQAALQELRGDIDRRAVGLAMKTYTQRLELASKQFCKIVSPK